MKPTSTAGPHGPTPQNNPAGKFTTGSTMRHVVVMTATGSVGLMAIFLVDIANLFYISQLGQQELAAAIGYASTIMFFTISLSIGFTIAASAVVARAIGAGDAARAKRLAASSLVIVTLVMIALAAILYPFIEAFLALLGARGRTLALATGFMQIVTFSVPLLGLGMCFSGLLRARGDGTRAMHITLSGGIAAAILDPLLIFGLDLGIDGAAYATVGSRLVLLLIGLHGAHVVHRMVGRISLRNAVGDLKVFWAIAVPAVITQIATPVGNAYITASIADFGDDAVAGWAIVGRVIPVVFGTIFSLSGAVGPILGQNYGARLFPRIVSTMRDALIFILLYTITMWIVLMLAQNLLIDLFDATDDAAELIAFFCVFVAGSFIFAGALFVANAAFNNLGFPFYATLFNWGRATLGTIPFVYVGQAWGATGVLAGWGLGAVLFGTAAVIVAFRVVGKLPDRRGDGEGSGVTTVSVPSANSPFTSGKGASAG